MVCKAALILFLAGTSAAKADFSFDRDVLPFGWPAGIGGLSSPEMPILTKNELAECLTWYADLQETDARARVTRAQILTDELSQALEKNRRTTTEEPKDETDIELDTIEKALEAQDPGLEQRVVNYLQERKDYFHRISDFSEACGTKVYRIEDLRSLTTK